MRVPARYSSRPVARVSPRAVVASIVSRYFTDLSAAAAARYSISNPVTANNDFEITVGFYTTDSLNRQSLWGSVGDFGTFALLNALSISGMLQISVGGTVVCYESVNAHDGKYHTLTVRRVSGIVKTIYDGVVIATNQSTGILSVQQIGGNNFGRYFTGIISDVKIMSAGVPLLDLPLDTPIPASQIIPNNAYGNPGAPASVMAVNVTIANSMAWYYSGEYWISDELSNFNNAHSDIDTANPSYDIIYWDVYASQAQKKYIISATVDYTGGVIFPGVGWSSSSGIPSTYRATPSGPGKYIFGGIFVATGWLFRLFAGVPNLATSADLTWSNITVKRILEVA